MKLEDCRVDGSQKINIGDFATSAHMDPSLKADYLNMTAENLSKIMALQDKLYADGKEGIVIMLQAMDAAGKDSAVKHVMSGVNPQGVTVTSFKQPNGEELAHDYLWRASKALPRRGMMAIFNRSYYEDVLVVRVHHLEKTYKMPDRCLADDHFFEKRYGQIVNFEDYLYENGYRLIKIFLHVSLAEQKKRFLARIDDETKNWKFSSSDLAERALFPQYMNAYEDAINATASKNAPWYIIPADQKWFARYLISQAIVKVMEECNPKYPELPKAERKKLAECKAELLGVPLSSLYADDEDADKKSKKEAKKASKKARKAAEKANRKDALKTAQMVTEARKRATEYEDADKYAGDIESQEADETEAADSQAQGGLGADHDETGAPDEERDFREAEMLEAMRERGAQRIGGANPVSSPEPPAGSWSGNGAQTVGGMQPRHGL